NGMTPAPTGSTTPHKSDPSVSGGVGLTLRGDAAGGGGGGARGPRAGRGAPALTETPRGNNRRSTPRPRIWAPAKGAGWRRSGPRRVCPIGHRFSYIGRSGRIGRYNARAQ